MKRKSAFDQPTIKASICEQLANGTPLREICRQDGFPCWKTVYDWMEDDHEFATAIARARVSGFDAIAAQCLEIADTPMEGVETTIDEKGGVSEKRVDMLGHRKLQIETRLKLLAKWDPKRYGEKLALGGADDLPPIKTVSDEQLEARIKLLQSRMNDGADKG